MSTTHAIDEQAVQFGCAGAQLIGVLSRPRGPAAATGVVVVVGGPQYRAGSHRQFVLLARALARAGHAVLRFDYRGMGDSEGAQRDFLDVNPDIGAAIDALQQAVPEVRTVALWGLCDAASAALLYCEAKPDARVRGLCLLNPWVRSTASLARTHVKHYYLQRLTQRAFWAKLLRGGVAFDALAGLWRNLRLAAGGSRSAAGGPAAAQRPYQARMARAWKSFDGRILLLLSGQDYTAKEFLEYAGADSEWTGALSLSRLTRHDLPDADHTFSDGTSRILVENFTLDWLADVSKE